MKNNVKIILASASPRRKELLKNLYDEFLIIPADIEEKTEEEISVLEYPEKIAEMKAEEIARENKNSLVIGCDTAVIVENEIFGKPENKENAKEMIRKMSGKTHKVITGCALCYQGRKHSFSSITEVEFFPLSEKEIDDYLMEKEDENSGSTAKFEWQDKAGGYGIQSKGGLLIKGIKGDYNNVVGLPVSLLKRQIEKFLEV